MILNISKFENKLRIKIKNKKLLTNSLTHKSANQFNNNEKLEFLGDRVIGLVLSSKLLELYPKENEGALDKRFARLVNKKTCASIGWKFGFQDFIILGDKKKNITVNDEKILSDACEAIVGAVYIDRGFDYVKDFVLRLWSDYIKLSNVTLLDSKTQLQEYSLKINKKLPNYKLLSSKGPRHNPVFKISVSIVGSKKFIGYGNSKQEAEQNAANNLLKNIVDRRV
tara:strand:+ start:73 stop:747 length:675 start_codon:yes stop_codon:yes gene_type:complete